MAKRSNAHLNLFSNIWTSGSLSLTRSSRAACSALKHIFHLLSESLIHGEKCKIARKEVKQVLVCSAFIVWNECVYLVKGAAGDRRPLRAVYISNTQLLLRLTSFPPQRIKIPPPDIWPHPPLCSELHPTFLGSLSPRSPGSKKCFFLFQLIFVCLCYPNKELLRLQV